MKLRTPLRTRAFAIVLLSGGVLALVTSWFLTRAENDVRVESVPPVLTPQVHPEAPTLEAPEFQTVVRAAVAEVPAPTPSVADGFRHFALIDGIDREDPNVSDPVELGDRVLELRCVDAIELLPIDCHVSLFRLFAPANERWSEGDQCVLELAVPSTGARVEHLPAGRYRVVIHESAESVDDPLEFAVAGNPTSMTFLVTRPAEELAFVAIYDENGTRVEQAEIHPGNQRHSFSNPRDRPWRRNRAWIGAGEEPSGAVGGGGQSHRRSVQGRYVRATPHGFEVGPYLLNSRVARRTASVTFRATDGVRCEVAISGAHTGELRRYVGVFVSRSAILEKIETPDGVPASELGDRITITSSAAPRDEQRGERSYLAIPVTVTVDSPRYERLSTSFRLEEGLPRLRLTSRE